MDYCQSITNVISLLTNDGSNITVNSFKPSQFTQPATAIGRPITIVVKGKYQYNINALQLLGKYEDLTTDVIFESMVSDALFKNDLQLVGSVELAVRYTAFSKDYLKHLKAIYNSFKGIVLILGCRQCLEKGKGITFLVKESSGIVAIIQIALE